MSNQIQLNQKDFHYLPTCTFHNQSGYSVSGFIFTFCPPSVNRFVPQTSVTSFFTSFSTSTLVFFLIPSASNFLAFLPNPAMLTPKIVLYEYTYKFILLIYLRFWFQCTNLNETCVALDC